jgi:hypothetical protein
MAHPERQELVWNLADTVLQKPDLLKVAMIITMGPADILAGNETA